MDRNEETQVDKTIDHLEYKDEGHEFLKDLGSTDKLDQPVNDGEDSYAKDHNVESLRYIGRVV